MNAERKLTISFILSSLWLSGGVRDIVEYTNGLTGRGHWVNLIFPGGTYDADMAAEIDPRVQLIETAITGDPSASLTTKARLTWALASAVPPSQIIVSTHTPSTAAGFIAAHVLRRGLPLWLYQDYPEMFTGRQVESWLIHNALRWHNGAFAISNYSKMQLERFVPGRPIGVGEGLSHADLFLPVPFSARPIDDRNTILYLGDMPSAQRAIRFSGGGGPDLCTESIRPSVDCLKGTLRVYLSGAVRIFLSPSREELADMYGRCHVFVSASWWESFGIPPLEAMACAAPVVATNSGGVLDFAEAGYNCLITPPQDPPALAEAILQVLNDPELAESCPPTDLRQQLALTGKPWSIASRNFSTPF